MSLTRFFAVYVLLVSYQVVYITTNLRKLFFYTREKKTIEYFEILVQRLDIYPFKRSVPAHLLVDESTSQ